MVSASVASTAGPLRPAPSSSDTRITPVPVATPLARPNTPAPTASPAVPRVADFLRSSRRSGTEAITAMPRMVPMARASSTL